MMSVMVMIIIDVGAGDDEVVHGDINVGYDDKRNSVDVYCCC